MKLLKSFAIAALFLCGQSIYAMSNDARKQNIQEKVSLVRETIDRTIKQVKAMKNLAGEPAVMEQAFKLIKGDIEGIVKIAIQLDLSDRYKFYSELYHLIWSLYNEHMDCALKSTVALKNTIDNLFFDTIQELTKLIKQK